MQHSSSRKQFTRLTIAFAMLALLFGMWMQFNRHTNTDIKLQDGTIFPVPRDISPFSLVSADDKPFTNTNLKGHWSLMFFGFTNCPQLCPTTLTVLNNMYTTMHKQNVTPMPQVVFISIDPERDTTKKVKKYALSFNKNFIGATGDKEALKKLTTELNILFMKVKNTNANNPNDYQVDHSGTILLFNPEGQLFALFSTPHNAAKLSHDVTAIEKHYTKLTQLALRPTQ